MSKHDIGEGCQVAETAEIRPPETGQSPARIGSDAVLRSGATVYPGVVAGDRFRADHHSVVRTGTTIGHDCSVGAQVVIGADSEVGNRVRIGDGVFLPPETTVEDRVDIGPRTVLARGTVPAREGVDRSGPTVREGVTVGANATIHSNVTVGAHSVVAAGAVVTEDVPASTFAVGVPAKHRPLPDSFSADGDPTNPVESDD